ncbi:hypothetical protein ACWDKQ_13050 [Saccharopolyspora sp. NPDC000995]
MGVVMATAAKALAAVSQEGMVRAEPRSGTVVADSRPALDDLFELGLRALLEGLELRLGDPAGSGDPAG